MRHSNLYLRYPESVGMFEKVNRHVTNFERIRRRKTIEMHEWGESIRFYANCHFANASIITSFTQRVNDINPWRFSAHLSATNNDVRYCLRVRKALIWVRNRMRWYVDQIEWYSQRQKTNGLARLLQRGVFVFTWCKHLMISIHGLVIHYTYDERFGFNANN